MKQTKTNMRNWAKPEKQEDERKYGWFFLPFWNAWNVLVCVMWCGDDVGCSNHKFLNIFRSVLCVLLFWRRLFSEHEYACLFSLGYLFLCVFFGLFLWNVASSILMEWRQKKFDCKNTLGAFTWWIVDVITVNSHISFPFLFNCTIFHQKNIHLHTKNGWQTLKSTKKWNNIVSDEVKRKMNVKTMTHNVSEKYKCKLTLLSNIK